MVSTEEEEEVTVRAAATAAAAAAALLRPATAIGAVARNEAPARIFPVAP